MSRSCRSAFWVVLLSAVFLDPGFLSSGFLNSGFGQPAANAQGTVGFGRQRPFVIGFIPVVGRNGVGGVSIDAEGALARIESKEVDALRRVQREALQAVPAELMEDTPLRFVSLKRIEQAIAEQAKTGKPLPDAIRYLGGLMRIRYLVVDPESKDLLLGGPAEGWIVDDRGELVGVASRQPVLHLDDLIVALQSVKASASGNGVSCSIDPEEAGVRRLQQALSRSGNAVNAQQVARWEAALGPQQITIQGVHPGTHFARSMLAADFVMKRLAMNLERSPVAGLPSYLEMLQQHPGPAPRSAAPRWWMAPKYDAVLHDPEGLVWELRGPGVQTLTETAYVTRGGKVVRGGRAEPVAQRWATAMSERFEQLAREEPAFARLRNCIDMSVIAALIMKEGLDDRADYAPELLRDPRRVTAVSLPVPKTVASHASLIRKGRQWVVSVSGGVDVDCWSVLEKITVDARLSQVGSRRRDFGQRWWAP